jgi:hypothetical protein
MSIIRSRPTAEDGPGCKARIVCDICLQRMVWNEANFSLRRLHIPISRGVSNNERDFARAGKVAFFKNLIVPGRDRGGYAPETLCNI